MQNLLNYNGWTDRRKDWFSRAFLVFLCPVFFWRQTLGWLTLADHDATFWYLPIWKLAVEQVKSGNAPFWNPYLYSGTPLFAEWQPGLLDPINWLHLLGPTTRTMTAAQEASIVLALLGTFALARRLGMCRRAAIIAAVVFAFNGFLLARTIYPGLLHVTVLLPLLLWAVERLWQTGRWRDAVLGALVVSWQLFAGHPQPFVYSSLLVGCYCIFRSVHQSAYRLDESGPRLRGAVRFRFLIQCLVMFTLGSGLAAVQLAPAIVVAQQSVRRAVTFEFFASQSLHPISLLTILFPFFHGSGQQVHQLAYWGPYWSHNEGQFSIGLGALSLAAGMAISLWRERNRMVAFWTVVAAVAGLFAFGKYVRPLGWLLYQVPLVGNFRGSNRHWMEVTLAIAVLAGFAIDRLLRGERRLEARGVQTTIGFLTFACIAVGSYTLFQRRRMEALIRLLPDMGSMKPGFLDGASSEFYVPMVTAAILALVLFLFTMTRRRARWYPLLLVALVADYQLYALFAPISSASKLETKLGQAVPPQLASEERNLEPIRYHLLLGSNEGNFNAFWFYGHEMATGYDPLVSERYQRFSGINEAGRSDRWSILDPADRTLDLLNVRFLLVPAGVFQSQSLPLALKSANGVDVSTTGRWREITIPQAAPGYAGLRAFENLRMMPRAWLVPEIKEMKESEQLDLIRGVTDETYDPYRVALIDPAAHVRLPHNDDAHSGREPTLDQASAKIIRRTSSAMTLTTDASRGMLLVLSEVDYPGWRATVDGRHAELLRVNYLQRGLVLAPGGHRVEMWYWPSFLTTGALISLASAIICGLACWVDRVAQLKVVRAQIANADVDAGLP